MVVATLVHERYRFITEGFLPVPVKGGLVGILCQECETPLRYHSPLEDAWRIHCPSLPKNNQHNWRTWRCDQLNHERALINAGAPRPIVSSPTDWGSRISPSGVLLDPKPTNSNNRRPPYPLPNDQHHPFLGRQPPLGQPPPLTTFDPPQLDSLAGPHRAKVKYPCLRPSRGPTAHTHRITGNKGCAYQYCQACCLEYGLGPCSKHTRAAKNPIDKPHAIPRPCQPSQLIPASACTSSAASTTTQPTPETRRSRPGGRIHQWAQSANSLGRLLGVQTVAAIQNDCRERFEAVERQIAQKYDETKVVTILLWLDRRAQEVQAKVILAHFDQWPKARLDESSLLMQACTQTLGPTWNQALLFWDEKIDSWYETMVSFPHRFPSNNKVVMVRWQQVDPQTPGLPQSKSRPARTMRVDTSVDPFPPDQQQFVTTTTNAEKPPPLAATHLPQSDSEEIQVVQSTWTTSADHHCATSPNSDSDDSVVVVKSTFTKSNIPSKVVKRETSEDLPIFDPCASMKDAHGDRQPNSAVTSSTSTSSVGPSTSASLTSSANLLKKKWPSSEMLVSTLLLWYKECETRPPLQAWKEIWGNEWVLVPSTVYRNRLWVERVGFKRFSDQYRNHPRANVGEARILYKKEFQGVANV
ncbi:uncharacterized protein MELLADRAFT_61084 [Melampsora larici-populina 98AG31]|uniref:Uncharacterized protein n=1 Tax=Melampsora larici-populina (strain 98AG31 / pathotype 3-4-7) TaxID=747676 RepID=F4RDJ3_MELLP|nr:uncharacterized protein MELLADRAFT_61084 [Melampsora larici-populina 98AG31]EGG09411.1 hypothetical protein MELLADRAFT_61084 [Melampsora larici-populina 98AG31]